MYFVLRIEPFAVLFWALGIVCTRAYTETVDPARRPSILQPWYWHCTVRQGVSYRFNLREDASAPSLYPSCCIIYLCVILTSPQQLFLAACLSAALPVAKCQ